MNYLERYDQWLHDAYISESAKEELRSIAHLEDEIEDRFYKDLEFGTAGMRGKIAIGTNRMNVYTVGQSTQGLANYLNQNIPQAQARGVVIAYDCRHKSREFSERAARVLAANGIRVYLFEDIRPTPELSFAILHLNTGAGIVVTASHNPPEYNGFKVYSENGAQVLPEIANQIVEQIHKIKDQSQVKLISLEAAQEKGLLTLSGEKIDRVYYEKVKSLSMSQDVDKDIRVVYTPLHGTGNIPVRTILKEMGYQQVYVDEEQAKPDPEFSTVKSPNPEDPEAFQRAVHLGQKVKADILIATDPDCDRIAVGVSRKSHSKHSSSPHEPEENYLFFNGNQTGALLLDYLLARKKENNQLPEEGFIIKTIVTSEMGRAVASHYQIPTYDTLTGFKFICNKAMELEKQGKIFLFGYEESIGYLTGNFVRDKDAVISALLVVEMAAYYKKRGMTLIDVLHQLYQRHGYYLEHLESIYLEGIEGEKEIQKIMQAFRQEFPAIPGATIAKKIDYQESYQYNYKEQKTEPVDIPQSDVLKCVFSDGSWYAVRPSGTEPKIKFYMSFIGQSKEEAEEKLGKTKEIIFQRIRQITR